MSPKDNKLSPGDTKIVLRICSRKVMLTRVHKQFERVVMKSFLSKRFSASILWAGSICLVSAAGVVNSPYEASLRAPLAGGGAVTFACDGTITLASTVAITNDTSLDASGHSIVISGGSIVRLFTVKSNLTFTLRTLTLARGFALGTNGVSGGGTG